MNCGKMYTYMRGCLLYVFEKSKCVRTENRTKNSFFLSLHFSCPLKYIYGSFGNFVGKMFSAVLMRECMHAKTVSWNNLTQLKGTVWRDFCNSFLPYRFFIFLVLCGSGVVSTILPGASIAELKTFSAQYFRKQETKSNLCCYLKGYSNQMDILFVRL